MNEHGVVLFYVRDRQAYKVISKLERQRGKMLWSALLNWINLTYFKESARVIKSQVNELKCVKVGDFGHFLNFKHMFANEKSQ